MLDDQRRTTVAVTGRVRVRWFEKWTVRSDEKVPLCFKGPRWTVMRRASVSRFGVNSPVSPSCPDGSRRMFDVSRGAFTVISMVF